MHVSSNWSWRLDVRASALDAAAMIEWRNCMGLRRMKCHSLSFQLATRGTGEVESTRTWPAKGIRDLKLQPCCNATLNPTLNQDFAFAHSIVA